ncbi:hypothetical protein SAMN05421544_102160 [Riemerella columbipharyngis]|uniref:Uncharacterized protein n=1 Tax=Riemerella columbipharyngis TaxID=1071918 RepID=A0A1G6ZQ50_9FLAO|nr:hypothetical protein SAMN05421544_102160 [Riemerella columbipharyngis]
MCLVACRKEESTTSTSSSSSTEIIKTSTSAKITVLHENGSTQEGVVVLMFDAKVETDKPLPRILKEAVTDSNGLAYFDLAFFESSEGQTFYFAGFTKNSDDSYSLIGKNQPAFTLKKGHVYSSEIVIK